MVFRRWVAAKDRVFFDGLKSASTNAVAASEALVRLFKNYGSLAEARATIKELEHRGDQITHSLLDHLGRRTLKPLARDDVAAVAKSFDDVVDAIYAAVNRLYLFRITKPTVEMAKFADVLHAQTRELETGLQDVKGLETLPVVIKHCTEVNRLESEADRLHNDVLASLFSGKDAIAILKHKEVYDLLEAAADACEDVADGLSYIVQRLQSPHADGFALPRAVRGSP